jgi:hypothetical protein
MFVAQAYLLVGAVLAQLVKLGLEGPHLFLGGRARPLALLQILEGLTPHRHFLTGSPQGRAGPFQIPAQVHDLCFEAFDQGVSGPHLVL